MKDKKENSNFVEREWNEDIEGEIDEDGFFITPNGSFWDPDYVYFNREGFDKHGGRYDENGEYIPGKGWDKENNCYESEKEDFDEYDDEDEEMYNKNFHFGDGGDSDDLENDVFDSDILGKNENNIREIIEESSRYNNKNEEKKDNKINKEKEEGNK